jgi:hypothetical protein
MGTNYDAVAALYNWLRTGTDANAVAIQALVYSGTTGIWQQADLEQSTFASLQIARNVAGQRAKVLAISIHDLGEKVTGSTIFQSVGICLWDKSNGQDALRLVREKVRYYIDKADDVGFTLDDVVTLDQGLLHLEYGGRTGYRQSEHYIAEYDLLTYTAILVRDED